MGRGGGRKRAEGGGRGGRGGSDTSDVWRDQTCSPDFMLLTNGHFPLQNFVARKKSRKWARLLSSSSSSASYS